MSSNVQITIELTDVEYKGLAYVAFDPQEWVLTAAQARSQSAMTEIFNAEVQRMLRDPTIKNIPADKEQVVRDAQIVLAKDRPSPMTPPS
jgi:hypothetical protein